MQHRLIALSSLAVLASFSGVARAAVADAPTTATRVEQEKVSGTVRAAKEGSFTLVTEDGNSFTIQTNGETKYVKDGQESARGDVVKDGMQVTVTHEGRMASKVTSRSR